MWQTFIPVPGFVEAAGGLKFQAFLKLYSLNRMLIMDQGLHIIKPIKLCVFLEDCILYKNTNDPVVKVIGYKEKQN